MSHVSDSLDFVCLTWLVHTINRKIELSPTVRRPFLSDAQKLNLIKSHLDDPDCDFDIFLTSLADNTKGSNHGH